MRFTIPDDHPSLPGHFPGHPVVPGVVLLDRVLQAIEQVTASGPHTPDMGGKATTADVGKAVADALGA